MATQDIFKINNEAVEKFDLDEFYRDCPKNPHIPSVLGKRRRIIAIGDLHGDYDLTLRCLLLAKVIDNKLNWIGGDTVVVQTGDKIDGARPVAGIQSSLASDDANEDIKILTLFYDLHLKAIKQGGMVYSLLGNHELMNVDGNLKYVSRDALIKFADYDDGKINFKKEYFNLSPVDRGIVARKYAFKPGNQYAVFLGCTNISCVIIGSFLFVHAGIIPTFIKKLNLTSRYDITRINYVVRKWLLGLIKADSTGVKDIIHPVPHSLFWDRILGSIPPGSDIDGDMCSTYLKPTLKLFNIGNMVIGHTPQLSMGINSTCSGKLHKIDTGASVAFKKFDKMVNNGRDLRKAEVLEILNDTEINVLK